MKKNDYMNDAEFNAMLTALKGPAPHECSDFNGYTIDQLRSRHVVNQLKIDIVKARLQSEIAPVNLARTVGLMGRLGTIVRYGEMAATACSLLRRALAVLRRLSARKADNQPNSATEQSES